MNAIDILTQNSCGRLLSRQQTCQQTRQRPGSGQRLQRYLWRRFYQFHRGYAPARPRPQVPRPTTLSRSVTGARRNARGRASQEAVCAIVPGTGAVPSQPTNWNLPTPGRVPAPLPRTEAPGIDPDQQNQEAVILIRAMIQAAKADGRLTPEEQSAILQQVGGATPDAQRFLEREFQTSTDARDFAWSVPLGLEQKVYAISLTRHQSRCQVRVRLPSPAGPRPEDSCRGLRQNPRTLRYSSLSA